MKLVLKTSSSEVSTPMDPDLEIANEALKSTTDSRRRVGGLAEAFSTSVVSLSLPSPTRSPLLQVVLLFEVVLAELIVVNVGEMLLGLVVVGVVGDVIVAAERLEIGVEVVAGIAEV